jgi:hypothetical protein
MSQIFICGIGAVSPAGWGLASFQEALERGQPLAEKTVARPGWEQPLRVRQTPPASPRPAFLAHARLRRTSPIAHYVVSASLEALGADAAQIAGGFRLGIVYCAMSGCVNYSRRFYDEALKDPATASPLVFPETVFNSPASHIAALLGTTAINYTIVGDPGTFIQGLALAAAWLDENRVDGCLVIGAEEMDWLTADATRLFDRRTVVSDGAGVLYLKRSAPEAGGVILNAVTDPQLFHRRRSRREAAVRTREALQPFQSKCELLCDGLGGLGPAERDEQQAWSDWQQDRLSVKKIFGEGFMAAAAWQCVAAAAALRRPGYRSASVNIVGTNQQSIAAHFQRHDTP